MAGVTKSWPDAAAPVLDGVSLSMPEGILMLIEGANGAGKTTLMRIIAGMLDPDGGEVRICDARPTEDRVSYQRQIGMVSAGNTGLYSRLNARQHLSFTARIQLVDRARRNLFVDKAVSAFALEAFVGRRVDRLSMGQRQRLRLAMAFLHQPAVVLLDEPATSLDAAGRSILETAISRHLDAGRSVVWLAPSGSAPPAVRSMRLTLVDGSLRAA